jgi:hypothetical protein
MNETYEYQEEEWPVFLSPHLQAARLEVQENCDRRIKIRDDQ